MTKNADESLLDTKANRWENEEIALEQVQQRWARIFSKYSDMGIETIQNAWQQSFFSLNNPFLQNYRIKQILATPNKMESEDLGKALSSPENYELELTRVSMHLYYVNYVYNFLIKLNRDTPMYKYYVTPEYLDEAEMNKEAFKKESQKVDKILKEFKPGLTLKTISTQVYLEGKSSYLPRISYNNNDINFFVMQKLNTDMVKLTGFGSKQQFIASFNMMIFLQPAYDIHQYPEYIQQVWYEMNNLGIIRENENKVLEFNPLANIPNNHTLEWNGKYYMYWVQLPQELCYTFYSDGAHPMAFPDTIGLFNDLNDLADYRWLQANLLSKGVNSILTAEVPIIKDPKAGSDATVINPDTVLGYQDLFMSSISGNILPFFAPFTNYSLHTLENQPEALDIIYDRTRDLIATSGNASLLPITDKPSIASVKAAQNIQASRNEYLTKQFEKFLNNIINNEFGLKYKWKVTLWGDIFNIREDTKILKELVASGLEGFVPKLLSANDETLEDYRGNVLYMKALNIKIEKNFEIEKMKIQNELKKKISENNEAEEKEEDKNNVGRPSLPDGEVENDNTGISKDQGNNVSDIKEFNMDNMSNILKEKEKCPICGNYLNYDEDFICEECLELLLEYKNN